MTTRGPILAPLRFANPPSSAYSRTSPPLRTPSARRSSYPFATPIVPPFHYASMYDTLSRRWGQQAAHLADHGEFARTACQKRMAEADGEEAAVDMASSQPPAKRRRAESVASPKPDDDASDAEISSSLAARHSASTRPVMHQRSTSLPAVLTASAPSPRPTSPSVSPRPQRAETTLTSSFVLSRSPPAPQLLHSAVAESAAPSSTPVPAATPLALIAFYNAPLGLQSPKISSLLVRSPSASINNAVVRAEALIKVVQSFETVLHYRADGWRVFGDALKGGAGCVN